MKDFSFLRIALTGGYFFSLIFYYRLIIIDQWKRNERKWKGMLWTPSSGSYFSFLFSLLRCWLQPKILSMVWHNITVLSWSRNQTMASFIHFILPVQGARPLLFLCENRELQKRREKKEILKPFAEALQTYGRFLRNYSRFHMRTGTRKRRTHRFPKNRRIEETTGGHTEEKKEWA